MTERITKYAFALAGLLVAGHINAETTPQLSSKDVADVVINGQQDISDWFRAESRHFIVYSDTNHKNVSQLLNKLERFDYLLRLYSNLDIKVDNRPKLTFYYQARVKDLDQIDKTPPPFAIGLYNSCELGVQGFGAHMFYGVNPDIPLEKQPENESLSYIFEAYARHFLYRYTDVRGPNWYIDGFAQYFANTRFSDTETVVGKPPQSVRDYLLYVVGHTTYSLDYKDILLGNNTKGYNVAGVEGVKLEFQAKAWALTHYILSSKENLQHFRVYNHLVDQGIEHTQAFEQAFGYKVTKLSTHLWNYKRKSAEALKLNLTAGGNQDIHFSNLPISANKLILADAALKACPTPEAGVSLLQKIVSEAKKFPQSDYAQLVLSRAQIHWGNAQDALPYLTTKAKTDNFETFYLLGLANLRLAEQSQGDAQKTYLVQAQEHLLKALTLNPLSAETAYAGFKAGLAAQDIPSEKVLNLAIQARQLAPEVNSYIRSAALAHAFLKQIPETEHDLALLAQNTRDTQMADWAKNWGSKLNSGVTRVNILAEMRRNIAPNPSFKEWTIASDEVMKAVIKAQENVRLKLYLELLQAMKQQGATDINDIKTRDH